MLIDIDKIIVKDRIRKDFGNIEGLANSIKKIGLANAILITPDFELIAGERRYKAIKLLGYKQIEARIMSVEDEEHMLNLEIDENEERKEFSKLERLDCARELERIERIKAEKRRESTLLQNTSVVENFPPRGSEGKTRDIVANKLGIGSGKQYEKEKYIENNLHFVTDEEKLAWDKGDISDHAMYKKIKSEKEALEDKTKQLEQKNKQLEAKLKQESNKLPKVETKVIDNTDYETIEKLKSELKTKTDFYNKIVEKEKTHNQLMEMYKHDSEEYKKLKREMELITKQKNDLSRSLNSATELSGLIFGVERFIKEQLAPIKYSRAIMDTSNNDIVQRNLSDIVAVVQKWCDEMNTYLTNKNNEIIDVKFEEEV